MVADHHLARWPQQCRPNPGHYARLLTGKCHKAVTRRPVGGALPTLLRDPRDPVQRDRGGLTRQWPPLM